MSDLPDHARTPVARPDVEMAWFDGEVVLFDPVTRQLHTLSGAAAAVWLCCDGTQDVEAMTAELADTFGVPAGQIGADVIDALGRLDERGLLVGSTIPQPDEPGDEPATDERVVLPPPYG